jgi:sec-independent protein translocase protein TatB
MFDVGFSELIVIGVVALVVVGPERLPKVARTVGLLLGRAQRYVNDVKADINREMELDELRKLQAEMKDTAQHVESSITESVRSFETQAHDSANELRGAVNDTSVDATGQQQTAQSPASNAEHASEHIGPPAHVASSTSPSLDKPT